MATITLPIASFANGLVRAEIDLDDSNLRVRVARVINDSDYPALIEIFKAGSLAVSRVVSAHSTQSKNVPGYIVFAMDEGDPVWGYPPAVTMADIEIHCRWG